MGETEPCKLQAATGHMIEPDRCGVAVTHQLLGEAKWEGPTSNGKDLRKECVCVCECV